MQAFFQSHHIPIYLLGPFRQVIWLCLLAIVFDNTGGSWHWEGALAEGVSGGADCDPVLQHA